MHGTNNRWALKVTRGNPNIVRVRNGKGQGGEIKLRAFTGAGRTMIL